MAREQRRLAAILAADVVGYSRLMGQNESGTLARLREHRKHDARAASRGAGIALPPADRSPRADEATPVASARHARVAAILVDLSGAEQPGHGSLLETVVAVAALS